MNTTPSISLAANATYLFEKTVSTPHMKPLIYWFPFLFAWTAQRVLLRYGGLQLYRRCVPLFLGMALGHILIGGFVWRIVMNSTFI